MDKIILEKMEFYGYHGVYPEENKLGQRYRVDLTAYLDLKPAGQTDDLNKSVNYAEIYTLCKEIVEGERFDLIEAVAERIAAGVLTQHEIIQACTVRVIKPDPPIPGHYQSVAVEIERKRESA
ncbi:dihydroneopterin aldolase [Bacillus sp. FJAT-27916]|uniref:dihydroneopterin aldolase n=1 Tax=Bacillaceae TaxID=186817 RepID=UPI0006715744|nr:dihydroneopterin aldolase [Bacillus sp. FJAT-27916]KMY46138.1 dihydroneopterin aldolase [Bacillus sp. FJAT-27916]